MTTNTIDFQNPIVLNDEPPPSEASLALVRSGNRVTSSSTGSTSSRNETTEAGPSSEALVAVAQSQDKANAIIQGFLERIEKRLEAAMAQQQEALKALEEAKPQANKMNDDEWRQFEALRDAAMKSWVDGAAKNGTNKREGTAINAVNDALTNNAKFMTLEQAAEMVATASRNGLGPDLTGRGSAQEMTAYALAKAGRDDYFEDGKWQGTLNSIKNAAFSAQTQYQQDLDAWQQRQNVAKLKLNSANAMISASQRSMDQGITLVKSMGLNELMQGQNFRRTTTEQKSESAFDDTDEEQRIENERNQAIEVIEPQKQPVVSVATRGDIGNLRLKLAVNIG